MLITKISHLPWIIMNLLEYFIGNKYSNEFRMRIGNNFTRIFECSGSIINSFSYEYVILIYTYSYLWNTAIVSNRIQTEHSTWLMVAVVWMMLLCVAKEKPGNRAIIVQFYIDQIAVCYRALQRMIVIIHKNWNVQHRVVMDLVISLAIIHRIEAYPDVHGPINPRLSLEAVRTRSH